MLLSARRNQSRNATTVLKKVCLALKDRRFKKADFTQGHRAVECKADRKRDLSRVADKTPDAAWDDLKTADESRDLDDIREVGFCSARLGTKLTLSGSGGVLQSAAKHHLP